MLSLVEYKQLIALMPVLSQSFIILRKNWERYEDEYSEYKKLNDKIFSNKKEIIISRKDLFDEKGNDYRLFVLKTIYWGYPAGMRGKHFRKILEGIDDLSERLKNLYFKRINIPGYEIIDFLKNKKIHGVGISTKTKFLYFLRLKIKNKKLIIIDQRLINVFSRKIFEEYKSLQKITYGNAKNYYLDYIYITNDLAKKLKVESDRIEMFLYTFGLYLKS